MRAGVTELSHEGVGRLHDALVGTDIYAGFGEGAVPGAEVALHIDDHHRGAGRGLQYLGQQGRALIRCWRAPSFLMSGVVAIG